MKKCCVLMTFQCKKTRTNEKRNHKFRASVATQNILLELQTRKQTILTLVFHFFLHRQQQRENLRQFKLNSLLVTLAFFHCVTTLPGNVSFGMWTIFPEVYSKFDGRYLTAAIFEAGSMPTPIESQNSTICG